MKRRLSSPRFRRRLAWIGGGTIAAATIVAGSIMVGNTGRSSATPIDHTKKPWVYKEPKSMVLTKHDRLQLFRTSALFVRTAVARKHLDSAWDMLGPEMKAGQTRKSWDTGFNNVVPFKADGIEAWDVAYSYNGDVALDLSLYARGKGKNGGWSGKTFTLELKRDARDAHRWLVAAWVPKGIGGGGTLSPDRRSGPPPPPVKPTLSAKWMLVPGSFLGGLLVLLAVWALTGAVRSRRATRRYAEALGYNSTSNPS